jgi:nitrate/nitrite-specific signal transduction histidine kinase
MRERSESLAAQFSITSAPGSGTVVEVAVPVGYATSSNDSSVRSDV